MKKYLFVALITICSISGYAKERGNSTYNGNNQKQLNAIFLNTCQKKTSENGCKNLTLLNKVPITIIDNECHAINKVMQCSVGAEYKFLDAQGFEVSVLLTATAPTCSQAGATIDAYVMLYAYFYGIFLTPVP